MDSLLTNNCLGFARDISGSPEYNAKYGVFSFASERSDRIATYFTIKDFTEKQKIISALVAGKNTSLPLYHGDLGLEFDGSGLVVLSWTNIEGVQTATFNEVELLHLMDLHWVRSMILNRRKSS